MGHGKDREVKTCGGGPLASAVSDGAVTSNGDDGGRMCSLLFLWPFCYFNFPHRHKSQTTPGIQEQCYVP